MKELEKTKRISIASVLFILIVLIALLAYKRPKHLYSENTKSTLEKISTNEYFVSLSDINFPDNVLIDIRNKYEFEKGHLENAINIYAPEILSDKNSEIFEKLREDSKTIILYGNTPGEVVTPFMILHQLGVANIKILSSFVCFIILFIPPPVSRIFSPSSIIVILDLNFLRFMKLLICSFK